MEVQSSPERLFYQCPKPKRQFRIGTAQAKKYFIATMVLFFLLATGTSSRSAAQKMDSVRIGTVEGQIRDSAHNYALQSASLAIYMQKDTSIVSYQLSENFGKFHCERIPVGTPLIIKGFYIGYKSVTRRFTVSPKEKTIDLKELNLER